MIRASCRPIRSSSSRWMPTTTSCRSAEPEHGAGVRQLHAAHAHEPRRKQPRRLLKARPRIRQRLRPGERPRRLWRRPWRASVRLQLLRSAAQPPARRPQPSAARPASGRLQKPARRRAGARQPIHRRTPPHLAPRAGQRALDRGSEEGRQGRIGNSGPFAFTFSCPQRRSLQRSLAAFICQPEANRRAELARARINHVERGHWA